MFCVCVCVCVLMFIRGCEFVQIPVPRALSGRKSRVPPLAEYSPLSIWNWGENGNFAFSPILHVRKLCWKVFCCMLFDSCRFEVLGGVMGNLVLLIWVIDSIEMLIGSKIRLCLDKLFPKHFLSLSYKLKLTYNLKFCTIFSFNIKKKRCFLI